MPSKLLAVGLFALLVVTAGCLGAGGIETNGGQLVGQSDSTNTSTISVSAAGEATAAPDLALVRVAVVEEATTAEAAREGVAADVASMREALRAAGVPDDVVRTTSYTIVPQYDYSQERRELIGYQAVHAFEIEADVNSAGPVIDAAVGGGADRVDGVTFTLREETRRDLRAEALREAMTNARSDADVIAQSAGVQITGLHTASTADFGYIPVEARVERAAGGDAGAPTVLEPGPVTVSANVQVAYRIG